MVYKYLNFCENGVDGAVDKEMSRAPYIKLEMVVLHLCVNVFIILAVDRLYNSMIQLFHWLGTDHADTKSLQLGDDLI